MHYHSPLKTNVLLKEHELIRNNDIMSRTFYFGTTAMYIDIEANENIHENFSMLYRGISESREIYCIKYNIEGKESPVQVIGWDSETRSPCAAYACEIEESGDGVATLIYGGTGGIRIKPLEDETDWELGAPKQKGITHLVYPRECFIIYKDEI